MSELIRIFNAIGCRRGGGLHAINRGPVFIYLVSCSTILGGVLRNQLVPWMVQTDGIFRPTLSACYERAINTFLAVLFSTRSYMLSLPAAIKSIPRELPRPRTARGYHSTLVSKTQPPVGSEEPPWFCGDPRTKISVELDWRLAQVAMTQILVRARGIPPPEAALGSRFVLELQRYPGGPRRSHENKPLFLPAKFGKTGTG